MVKYNKDIRSYEYVLSFDLASIRTGWAIVHIAWDDNRKYTVVEKGIIDTQKFPEEESAQLQYQAFCDVLTEAKEKYKGKILVTKERLPNQNGKYTTIETLQSLAKTHALFDLAVTQVGIEKYDDIGTHVSTVRAYFRKIIGNGKVVKKEQVRWVVYHNVENIDVYEDLNITDAVAVAMTFVDVKWNADIAERIRTLVKAQQKYKSQKKKMELGEDILHLRAMKIPKPPSLEYANRSYVVARDMEIEEMLKKTREELDEENIETDEEIY